MRVMRVCAFMVCAFVHVILRVHVHVCVCVCTFAGVSVMSL